MRSEIDSQLHYFWFLFVDGLCRLFTFVEQLDVRKLEDDSLGNGLSRVARVEYVVGDRLRDQVDGRRSEVLHFVDEEVVDLGSQVGVSLDFPEQVVDEIGLVELVYD